LTWYRGHAGFFSGASEKNPACPRYSDTVPDTVPDTPDGSVASPHRETEGMKDGSDAIADWPVLNALANTACGASWVSVHHGGGVGIGYSIHAGMVIVADGTKSADERLQRVLTCDPAMGIFR